VFYTGIYSGATMGLGVVGASLGEHFATGIALASTGALAASAPLFALLLIPSRFALFSGIVRWLCACFLLFLHFKTFVDMARGNASRLLSGQGGHLGPLVVGIIGSIIVAACIMALVWPDLRRLTRMTFRGDTAIAGGASEAARPDVTVCLWGSIVMAAGPAVLMTCGFCLLYGFYLLHGSGRVTWTPPSGPMWTWLLWASGPLLLGYSFLRERSLLRRRSGRLALGANIWFVAAHLAFLPWLALT